MRTGLSSIASVVVLTIACSDGAERRFTLPTAPVAIPAPTAPPASPVPAPPPYVQPPLPPVHPPGPSDVNPIEVGEVFTGRVTGNPPECVYEPAWPCQYFQLTPSISGLLVLEVEYSRDAQPSQGVDISLAERGQREIYADFYSRTVTRLKTRVRAGVTYEITLWYTFPDLDYQLRATMEP